MSSISDITREAFAVEEAGLDWRSGLAGAVCAVVPVAIGIAVGEPTIGFTATIGGLNTALGVPRANLRARVWWGVAALVGGCISTVLSQLVADHTWSLVLATIAWVGVLAFWRANGRAGALLGFATSAVFVILSGLPSNPDDVLSQLGWYAAGGALGLVLMVAARQGSTTPPIGREALTGWIAGFRDRSLTAHAGRLTLAVALGTLVYRGFDIEHGYWIPLTILAILQPDERATTIRVIQRAAGTLGGAALILLITLATDASWLLLVCAAACAFGLYALDHRSYFWLVVLLTPTVLFMISAVDFSGGEVALDRVADSSLGLVIGFVIGEAFWRLPQLASRPGKLPT